MTPATAATPIRLAEQDHGPDRFPAFADSVLPLDVGHNVAHHGFTNLKGRDQVWVPMSAEEWQNASKGRRVLERIYRSGFGQGLYYPIEMWWKKLILPTKKHVGVRRAIFWWDNVLVLGVARRGFRDSCSGRSHRSLGDLDLARRIRAAVPRVQLHHGLRDLRAAHAPRGRVVRQA